MKDLDSLLEQENEMGSAAKETTPRETEVDADIVDDKVDSLREVIKLVEENTAIDFIGSNSLTQSNVIFENALPARSKFNVKNFAELAGFITEYTGTNVTQRQAAASWYYILYQMFYDK